MSPFRGLLAELKRRGVWRIAVVYAGAAFVAVEAADLFLPNLGLPEWTVGLAAMVAVAGFPVAIVLAWAFDLTPEGVQPAEAEPGTERASGPSRRLALAVLAAVTVLLGGAGWWAYDGGRGDPEIRRLAVLPLSNLMDDPDQEYFVQGMHDRLISELQQAGVAVIARTSVMPYAAGDTPVREIARELGIDAVIEGSVFRSADRVLIEARLVDGVTEEYLWQESFDADLRDVGTLHRDLIGAIAVKVQRALDPDSEARWEEPPSVVPEAYVAYLRGRFHAQRWTEEDLNTARGHFTRALEIDSAYAPAWLGISHVWGMRAQIGFASSAEAREHGDPPLERALELDPELPDAHAAIASRATWGDWDWERGERAFRRTLELNPGSAETRILYGHLLTILGRWDEAHAQIEIGLQLDPLNPFAEGLAAVHYFMTRRYDETIRSLRKVFRENPGTGFGKAPLASALRLTGRDEEALRTWREEYEIRREPAVVAALDRGYEEGGYQGAYRLAADTMAARFSVAKLNPIDVAAFYMAAGETDRTLDWLEVGIDERDQNLPYIGTLPTFESLHDHPRFREIARRVNVPVLSAREL